MKKCSPKNEKKFAQLERELRDLDEEIASISSELENGPNKKRYFNKKEIESKYSQKNLNKAYKTPQSAKSKQYDSYQPSFSPHIQEQIDKTEINLEYDDEDENNSTLNEIFPNENISQVPKDSNIIQNYVPISERIKETIRKKQDFIRKEKEKEEKAIKAKCSFTPTKFNSPELDQELNWEPRSEHRIYQKELEKNQISPDAKKINKKSEKIIRNLERQDSFYSRQIESDRKKKSFYCVSPILKNTQQNRGSKTPQQSDKEKILSGVELRELNTRLMRPPNRTKAYLADEEALNANKKVTLVNKEHIEQLYENSLNSNKEEQNIDNNQKENETEFTTPKSKKVTPQKAKEIGEKMYMDSITSMRETRRKANEMKEYFEEKELKECTFRPVINPISPKLIAKNQSHSVYSNVKGTDDYYQRMYLAKLKREKEQESSYISDTGYESYSVSRSPIKYYSPPSSSPKKNREEELDLDSFEVDSLLQEIDSSFVYDPNAN